MTSEPATTNQSKKTTVYHGCATWNIEKLLTGESSRFMGLFVTKTYQLAGRYANSQAAHEVMPIFAKLEECAAIVELETSDEIIWHERETATSLDVTEAIIEKWSVKSVTLKRPTYRGSNQHAIIDRISKKVKVVEIKDQDSIPAVRAYFAKLSK
jgi:hypothetical protein